MKYLVTILFLTILSSCHNRSGSDNQALAGENRIEVKKVPEQRHSGREIQSHPVSNGNSHPVSNRYDKNPVDRLSDGSFSGWDRNNAEGITIVKGAGRNNSPAIRFETASAGDEWDTQLLSPEILAVAGHAYEFSFWIRSEKAGQGRVSFAGMVNNYPWTGSDAYFYTSDSWTQVIYNQVWDDAVNANVLFKAKANAIKIAFDLGKFPGVYYVDLNSIHIIDLDAPAKPVNLVENGTFDNYEAGSDPYPDWNSWGGTASRKHEISAEGEGYNGGKALIVHSKGTAAHYMVQAKTDMIKSLIPGHEYHVEAKMRCTVNTGSVRIQFQGGKKEATLLNASRVGLSWTTVSYDFTAENANTSLLFDLGEVSADYYIDEVLVYDKTATARRPEK